MTDHPARSAAYSALMWPKRNDNGDHDMNADKANQLLDAHADELLPAWEAMYEPGNVSDYLIGYANSEAAAKGAAEAWLRSQKLDGIGRLEWVPEPLMAVREHDQYLDLIEHHDDIGMTGTGINVRHRKAAS